MKKVNKKAIISVVLVIMTILLTALPVFAASVGGVEVKPNTESVAGKVKTAGSSILGYIQVIGSFIAVGVLMFLGIKYMTASASEKADIKKSIIPYVIGAIILLAAVNIVPIIESAGKSLIGS